MDNSVIIGVDGGATRATLAAVARSGEVLGRISAGGVNYNLTGMDEARRRLYGAVTRLMKRCGAERIERLCVGMSALDDAPGEETLRRFAGDAFDMRTLEMQSDAYMALMGATLGGPGVMTISGTGAMVVSLNGRGEVRRSGGWGYLLEDPGSSYCVAVGALKAVLAHSEGDGPETTLTRRALDYFGVDDPRVLLDKLYAPPVEPSRIAQFACVALGEARSGDRVAADILSANADFLARRTATFFMDCPEGSPVGIYGGLFQNNPWFTQLFQEKLSALAPGAKAEFPMLPPELGAVVPYMRRTGLLDGRAVSRMMQTQKEINANERDGQVF